jgi:isochorismate hydrolase
MSELALARESCALLIIDIQEKLAAAMEPEVMASVVRNTNILLEAARRMGIPVVVSEQYPRGLGSTVAGLSASLDEIDEYQSVRALREAGASVHLPVDAVISRAKHNYRVGLGLAERCGAVLSSTETIVMDLLGCARGDDFKAISKLIR